MNRRDFLKALGTFGVLTLVGSLTGCKDRLTPFDPINSPGTANMHSVLTGNEIQLTAQPVRWELAPGKIVEAWAYNGYVPGPEIRVTEGEHIRIVLVNELPEPTTIHWHGLSVPTNMDGVPGISQRPVQPGETFVYEFVAKPAGTRWYHTHMNEHKQLELGLYAPLIIEPASGEPYDREYTLVLDDWNTSMTSSEAPRHPGMGGMMGQMMSGQMGNMMGGQAHDYDTFTINGKAWPATQPLMVRKSERVKLRLINASATETHTIHLEGHSIRVTHTDGNALVIPEEADAVQLAPAERVDVEFLANNPGIWELSCVDGDHAERGMKTLVQYEGFTGQPAGDVPASNGLRIWSYSNPSTNMMGMPSSGPSDGINYELTLNGGMMMNPDVWTINGRAYPDTEPLWVRLGERVRIRLFNMSMEDHPMHLHGHSFRVIDFNGRPLSLVKDTVNVGHMDTVDIEFVADNPGTWFFHCHKPMHMEGGMVTVVRYG